MRKEIVKQFSGTIYKFVWCDYKDLLKNSQCDKVHVYERRVVQVEPYRFRWFYIGDLDDDDRDATPIAIQTDNKHIEQLSSDG